MADTRRRRRHQRRRRRKKPSRRKNKRARDSIKRGDFISSLPNDILQHILSFIPTIYAIRTSVLSKRWRHVWYDTPSLYIEVRTPNAQGINQTLAYYRAPKIMSFHLDVGLDSHSTQQIDSWIEFVLSRNVQNLHVGLDDHPAQQIDSWIEFAISRNLQNLSVKFCNHREYRFPDFFYFCSSIKQLSVEFLHTVMFPKCKVSWESLRNLSLRGCVLLDESIAKILSGCPKLESLTLSCCCLFETLDLSKSPSLTRLEIYNGWNPGPTKIVAPHIRYLRLIKFFLTPCNLVDVSSLIKSNLDNIHLYVEADCHQTTVLEKLAILQSVERLIVGENLPFLQNAEKLFVGANIPISIYCLLPSSVVFVSR